MTQEIKIFKFEENDVRVINLNSEPWFVAADVARVLEYRDATHMTRYLEEDEMNTLLIAESIRGRGNPNVSIISESGLYHAILMSRKPEAKKFRKWVTAEVLPSIRKHGVYATPATLESMIANPDWAIGLLQNLKQEQEARRALEAENEEMKPKALFADAVSSSKSSILIGELAKILTQNGFKIGQNRLFEELRNRGFLIRQKGERWNEPTQKAEEGGLIEVKKSTVVNADGSVRVTRTPKITGKGQIFFVNLFKKGVTANG